MSSHETKRIRRGLQAYCGVSPRCGAVLAVFVVFLLICVTVAPAFAQSQLQCDAQGEGGKGSNFRACADEILEQQEQTIGLLENMTKDMGAMGLLSADQMEEAESQIGFLKRSHERGRKENVDVTDEEFDALMTTGAPNGVCTFRLRPSFIEGPPGKPSERPTCEPDQIASNQCQEICEFNAAETDRNDKRGKRVEQSLYEVLQQTMTTNEVLEEETASLTFRASTFALATDDACPFDNPHPNLRDKAFSSGAVLAAHTTSIVAKTADKIAKNFCQQDVLGNNVSSGCSVTTTLATIAEEIEGFINVINGNFTSATVDANLECSRSILVEVNKQGGDIDKLKMDMAEVMAMLDEVRILLSTPQGLREGFPTK